MIEVNTTPRWTAASILVRSASRRSALPASRLQSWLHHGVRLDFHQNLRRNEALDLDHARGRANVLEELTMRPADLLPLVDVYNVHPGPHHIPQGRPQLQQRRLDVLERLNRLGI